MNLGDTAFLTHLLFVAHCVPFTVNHTGFREPFYDIESL